MAPSSTQAGQYYLLEKIAQGGMAEIYKGLAYDPDGIKKTVCIKKILSHISASREFIDMLVDEAKIAVKLNHGNIAQVYDLGKAGEDYFIVMEYVEGQSLSKIFKKALRQQKKIPIPIVCYLIAEVAAGLNYMHRKTDEEEKSLNIIHRDISPQNIVVSYSGTVKIIDFGIAKAAVQIGHTDSGILKGKFAYMSPEQARGDRLDHRSDIFSLGVIFHELLTGKRLFKAGDNKETLRNVRKAEVLPPSELNPDVPKELDAISLKTLTKDRRQRYAFASDFHDDLMKFLHTQYPDFKSEQAADFVKDLFKDEIALQRRMTDTEGATPHLILDKTRTGAMESEDAGEGTAGGAKGIDWREFMLEADWPEEKRTMDQGPWTEDLDEADQGPKEEEEHTISFKKRTFYAVGGILVGVFLAVAGFFIWKHFGGSTGSPRPLIGHPEPVEGQPQLLHLPPLQTSPLPEEVTTAVIKIQSNPAGASVYLNDQDTGQVTPTALHLDGGKKYTLGLYLTNYKFFKTELQTKPKESQTFHIELALDYGSVKISSEPSGATVYINDQSIGITPLIKEELQPGEIAAVRIEIPGFAPQSEEFQVAAGKQKIFHFQLEKLPRETEDRRPMTEDQQQDTIEEQNEQTP